jgi:hypothetical protein
MLGIVEGFPRPATAREQVTALPARAFISAAASGWCTCWRTGNREV